MHFPFRFRSAVALTAIAGIACVSAAHADTTVYNQPTDLVGSDSSQNDTTPAGFGNFATSYDNFTLGASKTISGVTWAGDYFNGNPGAITSFTINFYADNMGVPGTLLQSTSIAGSANETALGLDSYGNSAYSYSSALPTPFAAAAGQQYWMSIVPDLAYPPSWGWETGTGGDGSAYQSTTGFTGPVGNDLAFSLISADATTPEPGSVALMIGVSLAGVTCLRQRRTKKAV